MTESSHHLDVVPLLPKEDLAATTPPEIDHTAHIYAGGQLALMLVVVQHRSELLDEPEAQTLGRLGAMRQRWEGFLEVTSDEPDSRLAINEGPKRQVVPGETGLQTYKRGGEPTLLTRWAHQGDVDGRPVEIMSGEMALGGEVPHLLRKGFSPDTIWLHYALRMFESWAARDPQPEPTAFINTFSHNYRAALSEYPAFDGFDFSPAHLGQIHARYYNADEWRFDPGASDFAEQVTHADFAAAVKAARNMYGDHVVQNIAYECNVTRDHHFTTLYEQKIMTGRRLFSMLGWPHYFSLQPAFIRLQERVESAQSLELQATASDGQRPFMKVRSTPSDTQPVFRRSREDYMCAPAGEVDELLAGRSSYTLDLDYGHLAQLCHKVEAATWLNNNEASEDNLLQSAIGQLAAHRQRLREFESAFEGNALAYTPTLKKLQVTPAVVQLLQKHGYYASENILSGVDSLPVIVIEQPHDISTKACETFDLATNTPDARQNLDVAQYVEACARFAGCESRWSPFDAQLFAAVQDDPGVSVILERLDDPQFARALQRFLHQTVAYFQATGNILPLHDAGRVAFKRDMRGNYDYTVQHSPEDQARLFYPAGSYDSYLWNTYWHTSKSGHRKFLARTNHLRFIHGLLAATASPYYRLTDQPPLWPNKQFQNTRRHWERIYNFTRRLANGPPPDVDTYGSTIL